MNKAKETIKAPTARDVEFDELNTRLKSLEKTNKNLRDELAQKLRLLSEVPPQLSPENNEYHAELHGRITQELTG